MGNRYLFLLMLLFPLATMFGSGDAYAQTDEEYNAAMAAIKDGGAYYIVTDVEGIKYYLTADGYLTDDKLDAGLFLFKKTAGGEFKTYGWQLDGGAGNYFSNPASSGNINDTKLNTHAISGCRNTWEAQVFFLNENGKYAVRATNAASTTSTSGWNWVGQSFWAVKEGITAGYSFDVNYIWKLELPTDKSQIESILNSIVVDYEEQVWDDEEGYTMNMGTEFGQHTDVETWLKFWNLLQEVYQTAQKLVDEDYDYDSDPNAPTLEWANFVKSAADSMYQKILDSERPYMMPQDGYYRIISRLRYSSTAAESGYVDKAFAASISSEHANKGVYATINRNRADFLWKLTQHGDSIEIQNAGMGTYISFSSPAENRVVMTTNVNDASHMVFDYAGNDFVETDDDSFEKDIFYIRLASKPRGGSNYFHQLSHSSKLDVATASGNSGTDSGKEMELSFWAATFDKTTDRGTSEWYLEYVPDDEAEELIEAFAYIRDHDVLVEKNNDLRAKVKDALLVAKDSIRTELITDASQMTSPYSYNELTGGRDGGNLSEGVLIDGDKSTYWHSSYSTVPDNGLHYIQLSNMQDMVGDCELYLCQRAASNDHPSEFTLYGSDDPEAEREDWEEMVVLKIPNTGSGEENTISFKVEKPYPYVRVTATDCIGSSYGNRTFWHAAELQISTVRANPNSQYASLGEVAEILDRIYNENISVDDADVTREMYEALYNAYEAFLKAMVDPTELRDALATYADFTKAVVEGPNPGQWKNIDIASAFDALYKEVQEYNESGRYSLAQNHKYAVMLKAMAKSVMEKANGINTDKWYRIMFPTEEMYTNYNLDPAGVGGKSDYEDQPYMFGSFIAPGVRTSEKETVVDSETGEDSEVTHYIVEPIGGEDLRDGLGMYMFDDELIKDKDASMFRFIEREVDAVNYTPLFSEVKENMSMALDMSTTYKKGEPLITDASQLSSNAPDPQEGLHIEYACDGNPNTFWHSDYHKQYLEPAYLQVALNQPVSGLIQVDVTRRQNSGYGHIVRMYIQGSTDAENWTNVGYLEVPYTNMNETVTTMPVDLDGTYSNLRFILTQRAISGGVSPEYDPFAVITSADQYDKEGGWTYFHVAEFQIYPVTADKELSARGKALQQAFTAANKVVLKDAAAEDYSAAVKAYKEYQTEFNNSVGKAVLPEGADKVAPNYAIQNKATGLFVYAKGTNTNDVALRLIPTFYEYSAMGYERSLLHGKNPDGKDCAYLHVQNSNHRFCTWNDAGITTNSPLVIRETGEAYVAPTEFTFYENVKPGKIYNWCNSVTVTPQEIPEGSSAYAPLGQYIMEDALFLALKSIETIEAGKPAFFIYGDTLNYNSGEDDAEAVKFTMAADHELVVEGDTLNGVIGILGDHTLLPHEFYFSGNHPVWIKTSGYYVHPYGGWGAVVDLFSCPMVDPDGDYDFSICLAEGEEETGLKNVSTVVEKISQPGAVYSMDGKLLRTNATLNSLKSLGKGMYILNGIKVLIK